MLDVDSLSNQAYGLLFDVRRSVRYHDRRRSFFELMHHVTSVLTILLAGSVLFDLAKKGDTASWMIWLSVFAALLSATDMVFSYSRRADQHRSLRNRYIALEIKMLQFDLSKGEFMDFQLERIEIEADEPVVFRAVDLLSHNELVKATVADPEKVKKLTYEVSVLQWITSHIYPWPNI